MYDLFNRKRTTKCIVEADKAAKKILEILGKLSDCTRFIASMKVSASLGSLPDVVGDPREEEIIKKALTEVLELDGHDVSVN